MNNVTAMVHLDNDAAEELISIIEFHLTEGEMSDDAFNQIAYLVDMLTQYDRVYIVAEMPDEPDGGLEIEFSLAA